MEGASLKLQIRSLEEATPLPERLSPRWSLLPRRPRLGGPDPGRRRKWYLLISQSYSAFIWQGKPRGKEDQTPSTPIECKAGGGAGSLESLCGPGPKEVSAAGAAVRRRQALWGSRGWGRPRLGARKGPTEVART